MKNVNWNDVQEAQDFVRLGAGGYICKITNVEDVPEKEYLKIEYDIAEGEFKDYYTDLFTKKAFWGGKFIKSYKESALPFFKAFLTAVEGSNSGFKFNNDENTLKGKLIGLTLGEEEYKKNDGGTGVRLYVHQCRSIQKIRENDFIVPEFKYLDGNKPMSLIDISGQVVLSGDTDEDPLPF